MLSEIEIQYYRFENKSHTTVEQLCSQFTKPDAFGNRNNIIPVV